MKTERTTTHGPLCPVCGREFTQAQLTPAGKVPGHGTGWRQCAGSYELATPAGSPDSRDGRSDNDGQACGPCEGPEACLCPCHDDQDERAREDFEAAARWSGLFDRETG